MCALPRMRLIRLSVSWFLSLGLFFGMVLLNFAQAAKLTASEVYFLRGYQAYLDKSYGECADYFFQVLSFEDHFNNQARLYLASCQEKLNMRSLAAYHLGKIETRGLSVAELEMLKRLRFRLNEEYSSIYGLHASVFPYYGQGSFSAAASKQSAAFYGAFGEFRYRTWSGFVAGESISFAFRGSSTTYSQVQTTAGVSVSPSDVLSFRLSGAFQVASLSDYSLGRILGGGFTYRLMELTSLGLDYFHSAYPNLVFGASGLHQVNLSLNQYLFAQPAFALRTQFLWEAILPGAPAGTDSSTGFTLRSNYQRFALEIELLTALFQWSVTGWLGSEAFGVRNQGLIVFNALEEHRAGWSTALGIHLSESVTIRGLMSQELFVVSGPDIYSTAYGGGLHVQF